MVFSRCRWVHTIGMRFAVDVAYLDENGVVVKTVHMHPHRVGAPVWRARTVIEADLAAEPAATMIVASLSPPTGRVPRLNV